MAKAIKQIGLSRDLIIHPGETLSEVLEDRNMSQKELAIRTGVSEKHISGIVSGKNNISVSFANKLEYALDIDSSFWINLQSNYDNELCEYNDINDISEDEIKIANGLENIINYFKNKNHHFEKKESSKIVEFRKILGVSNLTQIPNLTTTGIWFRVTNTNIDLYSLFAWVRLCELTLDNIPVENKININELKNRLPEIKSLMHKEINIAMNRLKTIFSQCGVSFGVFKSFRNVPIQGFIKNSNDKILLCMTIRRKYADIFWFTLFHEIGHIINGDAKKGMIDYISTNSESEKQADLFAANVLINNSDYSEFVSKGVFNLESIESFAKEQQVLPCIVIGRLQKEGLISYNLFSNKKIKYSWID